MRRILPWLALPLAAAAGACTLDYDEFHAGSGAGGGGGATISSSSGATTTTTGGTTTTGAGGSSTTSTTSTSSSSSGSCGSQEKLCAGSCVPIDQPQTGCAAPACDPCALAHASATCAAGACAVASCNGAFLDCDGQAPNGCETDSSSDAAHCGICANACPSGFVCQNGGCECNNNSDCQAGGSSVSCISFGQSSGHCKCASTTCGVGQVCLAGNQCG